jgi:DNA-binding transcriptional MerR regulator
MAPTRLLPIAAVAKELDLPESTLHYWKNRFADHLPAVGAGRQKRFKPEAMEVFRTIARLLELGHTTEEIKRELAAGSEAPEPDARTPVDSASREAAQELGEEIAGAIARNLSRIAPQPAASSPTPGESEALTERVDQVDDILSEHASEMQRLADKLEALESELVRLRKDRREMEKFLLEKIKSLGG